MEVVRLVNTSRKKREAQRKVVAVGMSEQTQYLHKEKQPPYLGHN